MVEKRVAGIIRWLERLKKSYSSGAMESALMDAECARADLEDLRQDVWAKLGPSAKPKMRLFSLEHVMSSARTLSLAVIIVVMSVVPLSREVNVPAIDPVKTEVVQPKPIIVIREYEAPKPVADKPTAGSVQTASVQPKKQVSLKRTSSKRTQSASPVNATPAPKTPSKTPASLPYDKVYSLIQTGQRALKNNSSVIKIQ